MVKIRNELADNNIYTGGWDFRQVGNGSYLQKDKRV